jgi:hypothetical protein
LQDALLQFRRLRYLAELVVRHEILKVMNKNIRNIITFR